MYIILEKLNLFSSLPLDTKSINIVSGSYHVRSDCDFAGNSCITSTAKQAGAHDMAKMNRSAEDRKETKMFRLWARTFKDNRMLQDTCIEDRREDTRTHKIFHALEEVCRQFDLSVPIWLDKTISEFKRHSKVRFTSDNFIDGIDFDYLEIQIIEED